MDANKKHLAKAHRFGACWCALLMLALTISGSTNLIGWVAPQITIVSRGTATAQAQDAGTIKLTDAGAAQAAGFRNPLFTEIDGKPAGTADPGVLFHGGAYYVASTATGVGDYSLMPIRVSRDRRNWSHFGYIFPPEKIPHWFKVRKRKSGQVVKGGGGSPQLYYFSGKFVAYYSATYKETGQRCIGVATSSDMKEGFTDLGHPLICQREGKYSVIDVSLFLDPVHKQFYLLYKDDIECPEGKEAKRIVIRSIGRDGFSEIGQPHHILQAAGGWEKVPYRKCDKAGKKGEYASVEAPTMVYKDGWYYLFYSGAAFWSDKYGVGVARSKSPIADFERYRGNPILSGVGDDKFCGVGHQDITWTPQDGWLIFYHAYQSNSKGNCQQDEDREGGEDTEEDEDKEQKKRRYLMMDQLHWDRPGGWPRVHDGTPSE